MKNKALISSAILAFTLLISPSSAQASAFSITSPSDSASVTCSNKASCSYSTTVIFKNNTTENLYNTTLFIDASLNGLQYTDFSGNWTTNQSTTDSIIPPNGEVNTNLQLNFPSSWPSDTYTASLNIDGKTCNQNTTPPDCYYTGGKSFTVTLNIVTPTITPTPIPTATPTPTIVPTSIPTPTISTTVNTSNNSPTATPSPTQTTSGNNAQTNSNPTQTTQNNDNQQPNDTQTSQSQPTPTSTPTQSRNILQKVKSKFINSKNTQKPDTDIITNTKSGTPQITKTQHAKPSIISQIRQISATAIDTASKSFQEIILIAKSLPQLLRNIF